MYHLLIKKGGKQLAKLLITLSSCLLSNFSYSQINKSFDDSALLKKEIDSLLLKHGLKSKGFAINVFSINQQGGQTAYSITNNYYNDPNYIADSINYETKIVIKDSLKYIYFFPKKGVWTNPFIFYESDVGNRNTSLQGMIREITGSFDFGHLTVSFTGTTTESPCSKNSPIYITLKKDEEIFIFFGDYSTDSKTYLYDDGEIKYIKLKVNNGF